MNFSTAYNVFSKYKPKGQRPLPLAFFCFTLLILFSACSENIFESPYGDRSMTLDTLYYDQSYVSGIKNMNFPSYGNQLLENKAGNFNDLYNSFLIKFTNFNILYSLPDTLIPEIRSADILLYPSAYWGDETLFSMDLHLIDTDTSLAWNNVSIVTDTKTKLEGRSAFYKNTEFDPGADSVFIPLNLETVSDWYERPSLAYQNNGFLMKKSDNGRGMVAFHSLDISRNTNKRPKLRLVCDLYDSNAVFVKDTVFYIPAAADLQFSESSAAVSDSLFYLSQGNIFRSYLMLDSLRLDTLLVRDKLLNKAEQRFVMHPFETEIQEGDTLYLTARLFRTDSWESDSISYNYTVYSNTFSSPEDTIRLDISQLLQYLVSNPREMQYEGIFYYLNNEYNDFNSVTIDLRHAALDVIYTRATDE